MSRLSNLLRQVEAKDPQLAEDLAREVKTLSQRRQFGLNFERHVPETVELYGRPVRKGDKVRFLAPRGEPARSVDPGLWLVTGIKRKDGTRIADLAPAEWAAADAGPVERAVDGLVVVAEFRDPIYPGLVSTGKVERGGDKPFNRVLMPLSRLKRTSLVIGAPGSGKTVTLNRIAYGVATTSDWQVIVIDAKGDPPRSGSSRRACATPAATCICSRRRATTPGAVPGARSPTASSR